eukprot:TRINITY_DN1736_c0_g1_i4.p2 TRINITY_DN1736_c0_g1~~TRINITY_DN1736_c0_g1_i4.p2  ORF type:complete len:213 (+),score=34.51 TRINITY_DN1736_c0_g1_i4:28-666(+)
MSEEPVNQPPVSLAFPSFPSFPLTPCSPQNAFNDLPAEVAANIFSFLPLGERLRGRTVCKHWDQLMELPECWAFLDLKPYKSKITNQLLMSWQDKYCRVESLDIRGCHRLDSATISFVLANSPGLRKFVGVGLATIMVSALSVLAESCPNLTHLDLVRRFISLCFLCRQNFTRSVTPPFRRKRGFFSSVDLRHLFANTFSQSPRVCWYGTHN